MSDNRFYAVRLLWVRDPERYAEYQERAKPILEKHGVHVERWLMVQDMEEAWQQALHSMPGFSDSLIEHLGAVARDHQVGVFDGETSIVEDLTGRPPEKLEAFLERKQDYF